MAETKAELHEADMQRTALLSTLSNVKKSHVNCDGSLHIRTKLIYKPKRLFGNVKMLKKKMKT